MSKSVRCALCFLVLSLMTPGHVFSWIYPEHRDISILAVQNLDQTRRAIFDDLWREARRTHEQRLCEQGADVAQGLKPACIDWAALAAIAKGPSPRSHSTRGMPRRANVSPAATFAGAESTKGSERWALPTASAITATKLIAAPAAAARR